MTPSLAPLDPLAKRAAARRAWGQLLDGAARLADRLIATDGEEAVEDLHLRGLLRTLADAPFPSDGESAKRAAVAFVEALRGLLVAGRPRRKAILAPLVAAGARALGEVIVDDQEQEAGAWRARTGEA